MNDTSTLATRAADPYGAATRVDALERHRMNVQFAVHTGPTLNRALVALGGARGLKILDVGSGYGALLSSFDTVLSVPAEVRLTDVNATLLPLAAQRAREAGIRTCAHLGAIDAGPLPESLRGNDVVVCSFTATHLTDLPVALAHMAQAARTQGLAVVVDVDYPASFASGNEAAAQALSIVQRKVHLRGLSARLPHEAAACGLHPHAAIGCADWLQTYAGAEAVRDVGLGFIGSFMPDDPATSPWRRIGPGARLYLRRLAHVYVRS